MVQFDALMPVRSNGIWRIRPGSSFKRRSRPRRHAQGLSRLRSGLPSNIFLRFYYEAVSASGTAKAASAPADHAPGRRGKYWPTAGTWPHCGDARHFLQTDYVAAATLSNSGCIMSSMHQG